MRPMLPFYRLHSADVLLRVLCACWACWAPLRRYMDEHGNKKVAGGRDLHHSQRYTKEFGRHVAAWVVKWLPKAVEEAQQVRSELLQRLQTEAGNA